MLNENGLRYLGHDIIMCFSPETEVIRKTGWVLIVFELFNQARLELTIEPDSKDDRMPLLPKCRDLMRSVGLTFLIYMLFGSVCSPLHMFTKTIYSTMNSDGGFQFEVQLQGNVRTKYAIQNPTPSMMTT